MEESQYDEHFLKITDDWTGILVWRVVNFQLEEWEDIGSFYTGDAYLVLHGYQKGTSKNIYYDIYFWLGAELTQDEAGTVAYKATNLDDYLGGAPIQHRETQYHETDAFRKLFTAYGGIRYMDGGAESGFTKIEKDMTTTMYQVKGARHPVLQRVNPCAASLNQGDSFIVHKPGNFWLWIGRKANTFEKMKAATALDNLKASDPKAKCERLDDGETTPEFWEAIGGQGPIADAIAGGSDKEFELEMKHSIVRVEDGKFIECPFKRESLTSDGLFIVRCGQCLVCYIGSNCEVGKEAIAAACNYIEEADLPAWCPVEVCREGIACEELDVAFA